MADRDSPLGIRLQAVRSQIAHAAAQAGRSVDELTTIVVTKFHPAALVRELAELGVTDLGENRLQDAGPKAAELSDLELTWHFIGQLQTNKVRSVLEFSHIIHSIDRDSLVSAIAAAAVPVEIFIQVNLTSDPQRGGVAIDQLEPLAARVLENPQLQLRGLMAVAPLDEEPRRAFERVRVASESLRTIAPDARALSMGMSSDFVEAILEGATHLRIGTAITGNRPDGG